MTRRVERVNSLIRQEISELLQRRVKDPRLGYFITVTDVVTSADLRQAKIFISRIDGGEEKQGTMDVLAGAAGFLRNELAKRLRLRHVPEISFQWDDSIERGDHLLQLIDGVGDDSRREPHS